MRRKREIEMKKTEIQQERCIHRQGVTGNTECVREKESKTNSYSEREKERKELNECRGVEVANKTEGD